jgi:phage shock protein PspC (stress-responsive transcriptional regulator)
METTTDAPAPRRLYRVRDDRIVGGVCAGLGRYFDLNPTIYRIAFVVLALAGGTGVLIYLAAWAVIPDEDAEESWASEALRDQQEHPSRLIGLAVLAFALVLTLSEARFWPSPGNLALALALLVAGAVWWEVSARRGTVAVRRVPRVLPLGLGLVAVLLIAAAIAVAVAIREPLFAGVGTRNVGPAVAVDLPARYELGVGNLTVDLRGLSLPRGETKLKTTVGIGNLRVLVPANATVDVDGRAQAGEVDVLGRSESGTSVEQQVFDRTGSGRVLVLDARVGIGHVEVVRG